MDYWGNPGLSQRNPQQAAYQYQSSNRTAMPSSLPPRSYQSYDSYQQQGGITSHNNYGSYQSNNAYNSYQPSANYMQQQQPYQSQNTYKDQMYQQYPSSHQQQAARGGNYPAPTNQSQQQQQYFQLGSQPTLKNAVSNPPRPSQSERKGNLALTGELALGRNGQGQVGYTQVPGAGGRMNLTANMPSTFDNEGFRDDNRYNKPMSNTLNHPLPKPSYQPNDIAQAQNSLRLLKQKMQRNENLLSQEDQYSQSKPTQQTRVLAENQPSNYRKVFKVEDEEGIDRNRGNSGFSAANYQQKSSIPQQNQLENDYSSFGKGGNGFQGNNGRAHQAQGYQQQSSGIKVNYQSSMQKTLDKQDPQMMYNNQRFGQMQAYSYQKNEGENDDNDDFFREPGQRNKQIPTRKPPPVAKRQQQEDTGYSSSAATSASSVKKNPISQVDKGNPYSGYTNQQQSASNSHQTEQNGQKYYNFNPKQRNDYEDDYNAGGQSFPPKPTVPPRNDYAKSKPMQPRLDVVEAPIIAKQGGNQAVSKYDLSQINEREAIADIQGQLIECPEGCQRRFAEEALERHVNICKKVFQSKRKKFDMQSRRINNEGQEEIIQQVKREEKRQNQQQKGKQNAAGSNKNDKKAKWKLQSEQFRAVLKNNRGEGGNNATEIPTYDDREQCQHCNRKFNRDTLAKHEPLCGNRAKIAKASGKTFSRK